MPVHLLWLLSFLYIYTSDWASATLWGVGEQLFIRIVMEAVYYLSDRIDEVHWDDRLRGKGIQKGVFENVFVAIDTTECPVASGFKAIYSGYKKKHTLKYEAAVSLYSREFVWAPVPSVRGPEADQTAFNFYKIYEHMLEDELFIGDGHYAGLCKSMVGTLDEFRIVKDYYSKVRAIVEHAFNRLKNFNCMAQPWRHDVTAHWRAYKICLHVTNIIFRIKPLHKEPHPFLFIDVL